VGESGQTHVYQGTIPTTRRPRFLSFIQGSTLLFFFVSGDLEETRMLHVSRKEDKGRGLCLTGLQERFDQALLANTPMEIFGALHAPDSPCL
jgi:hypothetical protein